MASQSREIELKLAVAPEEVSRLEDHPRVRSLTCGEVTTHHLHSVYFDTAALDLERAGAALRVRRDGESWVQTFKAGSGAGAGLFERVEVEVPVPGEAPRLDLIEDAQLRAWLEEEIGDRPLEPVLTTEILRTCRQLRVEGSEVAFDLDVGEIRTARGSTPVCELELELRAGEPGVLYDLALDLQRTLALAPASASKADRGYALLTGRRAEARKAGGVELPRAATLDDAIAAVIRSCLEQLGANQEPAREGSDPEGVHQMRIAVRRLRSALFLFRRALPEGPRERFGEELRWLADRLGGPRDWDVFADETLAPLCRRFPEDAGLAALRQGADALRRASYETLRASLGDPRYARLALELGRWLTTRGWRREADAAAAARLAEPVQQQTAALLGRQHRKVQRLGERIGELPAPELHELRVRMKKLRYAAEFLRSAHRASGAGRYVRRAAQLQEVLGHLNDVAGAQARLAEILESLGAGATPDHHRAAGFAAGWISHSASTSLADLGEVWDEFAATRPFWA